MIGPDQIEKALEIIQSQDETSWEDLQDRMSSEFETRGKEALTGLGRIGRGRPVLCTKCSADFVALGQRLLRSNEVSLKLVSPDGYYTRTKMRQRIGKRTTSVLGSRRFVPTVLVDRADVVVRFGFRRLIGSEVHAQHYMEGGRYQLRKRYNNSEGAAAEGSKKDDPSLTFFGPERQAKKLPTEPSWWSRMLRKGREIERLTTNWLRARIHGDDTSVIEADLRATSEEHRNQDTASVQVEKFYDAESRRLEGVA